MAHGTRATAREAIIPSLHGYPAPIAQHPAPSTQHPAPTARNCAFVKANTKGVQVQTPISFFVVVGFWHSAAVVVGLAL